MTTGAARSTSGQGTGKVNFADELREVVGEIAELRARRDALILAGLAAGERPTDLARAAGVTRVRVYQIKDEGQLPQGQLGGESRP